MVPKPVANALIGVGDQSALRYVHVAGDKKTKEDQPDSKLCDLRVAVVNPSLSLLSPLNATPSSSRE